MAQFDAAHHRRRGHARRLCTRRRATASSDDCTASRGQADDRARRERCACDVTRGLPGSGQAGGFAFSGGGRIGRAFAKRRGSARSGRGDLVEGCLPGHDRDADQLVAGA